MKLKFSQSPRHGVVWCDLVWCGVPKALLPKGHGWDRTVGTIRAWLRQRDAVLQPLVGAPAARWQEAPKMWGPGPIQPATSTPVIGGREAKTTSERVVYQRGRAMQVTTAMEDIMAVI